MIKVYGMKTCPDCQYVHMQIKGNDNFEEVEIGAHVKNLKEFIHMRDNDPAFAEVKEKGYLGIPCFVREDGSVTTVPEEVGLKTRPVDPDAEACAIDHSGC